MKQTSLYIFLFFLSWRLISQEGIKPLNSNINYIYKNLNTENPSESPNQQKTAAASIFLPFLDDFSYPAQGPYPDKNLWMDSNVYINAGFAKAPPSIGVATFDGLNKHGYPYNAGIINLNLSYSADTLTSMPINLAFDKNLQPITSTDKVALSFYYQARGYGDPPESSDSLVLELYKPKQKIWGQVWFQKGSANPNTDDSVFKKKFILLKDTDYLHDGFQFRFRNKASVGGDFDHWNLDYVFLDKNRTGSDSIYFDDASITHVPGPFLKNYSSMPYQQFNSSEVADKYSLKIRSNYGSAKNLQSGIRYFKDATFVRIDTTLFDNIYPYVPVPVSPTLAGGLCTATFVTLPSIKYNFPALTDSTDYTLKHFIRLGGAAAAQFTANDTVLQSLRFRNYYALDDGSAEAGYYVNGLGGKMAVKIKVNVADSLRAVRIYFEPVGVNSLTAQHFSLHVWGDANGSPGTVIRKKSQMAVKYFNTGFKEFPEYKLDTAIFLNPGVYYIGFQQTTATGISVGFDRNYDFKTSLFYDSGSGWTQSQITGAVMIHPVLGKYIPPPVGVNEIIKEHEGKFLVYPNPASQSISISATSSDAFSFEIKNILGQTIEQGIFNGNLQTVSTSGYVNGIYLLTLKEQGRPVYSQKIIIQR